MLGVVTPPIAMMYVAQLRWAGIYFLAALAVGLVDEFYLREIALGGLLSLAFLLTAAVHAYRLATRYPDEEPRPKYSRWYGLAGTAAALFAVVFGIRAFILEPFRFPSGSMLPTIPLKAHLIVQKWGYGNYGSYGLTLARSPISAPLRRGDIIVFAYPVEPNLNYAKRLIGLPGDRIAYRGKELSINGSPVSRRRAGDYFEVPLARFKDKFIESLAGTEYAVLIEHGSPVSMEKVLAFPYRDRCVYDADGVSCDVPDDHYFVMGDNRDSSFDSRMWGFVPADHIVGKVLYIVP